MVSIPVRLYKAARRERIRFHHVYRPTLIPEPEESEGIGAPEPPPLRSKVRPLPQPELQEPPPPAETVGRLHNRPVAEFTETPVNRQQVLKGYEIERGRYVTFEPREVAALRPQTSSELAIAEFVRLEEIDPLFFDTSYYAAPDRGGEKPYALLYRALAETGYAALGALAMHGREHATLIRAARRGLVVHTLFYANEVHQEEEYASDAAELDPKELQLAKLLVQALAAKFEPAKLKDAFEERLHSLIQARAGAAVPAYQSHEVARPAPVIDIMEALRKSLEVARKPPKTEKPARPVKPHRRSRS